MYMFLIVMICIKSVIQYTFPGSSLGRGTFLKHLFSDRLCRIEFCGDREPVIRTRVEDYRMRVKNGAGHVQLRTESEACPYALAIATYTPHGLPQRHLNSLTDYAHLPPRPCLVIEGEIVGYPIVDPVQSHSPLGSAVDGESYEGGVGEGWFGGMYLVRPGISGV